MCLRLLAIDFALAVEHFLRHFLAPQETRIERGDVHGHVVAETLKILGARHEIALAIDLDEHADLAARVNVAGDEPLGRGPLRFLRRGSLSLFAQDVDGLLDIAAGFDQRRAAIRKARAGAVAQLLHELRGTFCLFRVRVLSPWVCSIPFCLDFDRVRLASRDSGCVPPYRMLL